MQIRKTVYEGAPPPADGVANGWIDVAKEAQVQVSSEDPEHPIEHALQGTGEGWRAGRPGPQTIRLVFDSPQSLRRIRIRFDEPESARTHEFRLAWSGDPSSGPLHEIVRQQWNFSPSGAKREVENYDVLLDRVMVLHLEIVPDISSPHTATATLSEFRVG